jgi:hypothetical protein
MIDGEDLALLINNTNYLYEQYIILTQIGLSKHMIRGDYSVTLAKKAWYNVVEKAIKNPKFKREIMREFELSAEQVNHIPIAIRREAAEDVMEHQSEGVVSKYKKMLALKQAGKPWTSVR